MRLIILAGLQLALIGSFTSSASSQYHDRIYITGGHGVTAGTMFAGIIRADLRGQTPSITTLVVPNRGARFVMDSDNRHLLMGTESLTTINPSDGGLFRLDPASGTLTTILYGPILSKTLLVFGVEVDHNGDYICGVWSKDYSVAQGQYRVWRVGRAGGITTLMDQNTLGFVTLKGSLNRDIDTGELLIGNTDSSSGPVPGILSIDTETGAVNTWSLGGARIYNTIHGLTQNHLTGHLHWPWSRSIYQLVRGASNRTTLVTLPSSESFFGGVRYDLQSAGTRRWVAQARFFSSPISSRIYALDESGSFTFTEILRGGSGGLPSYSLEFLHGRHTQSIKIGPQRWRIDLSAPAFHGQAYAAVLGYSGVRPGFNIPGGRRALLNLDALSLVTAADLIRPIFHPGPGVLDANGRASLQLDLTSFGTLGIPLWVAWVVLDPSAPGGIAYVPDTYVMRI